MGRRILDDYEWIHRFGQGRCPSTTSKGTPCPKLVAKTLLYWDDRTPWAACPRHLTAADRAAWEAQQIEDRAILDEAEERAEPACWSWPTPTDDDLEAYKAQLPQQLAEAGLTEDEIARTLQLREAGYDRASLLLALFHDGRCAFCGARDASMVTDHDHDTGLIRGYLCTGCNVHEGKRDRPALRRYRERPPAAILGIEKIYVNIYGDTPVREHVSEARNAVTRIRF